jgi:hypothetical protein
MLAADALYAALKEIPCPSPERCSQGLLCRRCAAIQKADGPLRLRGSEQEREVA